MYKISLLISIFVSQVFAFTQRTPSYVNPKAQRANLYFENQSTQNDVRIGYSLSDQLNPQLQFVRNHRKNYIELHYVYTRANFQIWRMDKEESLMDLSLLPGLGFANKLSGFNRFSYTFGYDFQIQTDDLYFDQSSFGYFAQEFDGKVSVLAKGGFKIEEFSRDTSIWFLMTALRETYNTYNITWGPVLRLSSKKLFFDLYGTVKGDLGTTFYFYY